MPSAAAFFGIVFLSAGAVSATAQAPADAMRKLVGGPATASDIARAVSDCIAADGDAQALIGLGYARLSDIMPWAQMAGYRRGAVGPAILLPGSANPLRCWVMSSPGGERSAVVDAIGAKLGVANTGSAGTPGWRVRNYSLTFDWFDEAGKPRVNRVEVYKLPQESK